MNNQRVKNYVFISGDLERDPSRAWVPQIRILMNIAVKLTLASAGEEKMGLYKNCFPKVWNINFWAKYFPVLGLILGYYLKFEH